MAAAGARVGDERLLSRKRGSRLTRLRRARLGEAPAASLGVERDVRREAVRLDLLDDRGPAIAGAREVCREIVDEHPGHVRDLRVVDGRNYERRDHERGVADVELDPGEAPAACSSSSQPRKGVIESGRSQNTLVLASSAGRSSTTMPAFRRIRRCRLIAGAEMPTAAASAPARRGPTIYYSRPMTSRCRRRLRGDEKEACVSTGGVSIKRRRCSWPG